MIEQLVALLDAYDRLRVPYTSDGAITDPVSLALQKKLVDLVNNIEIESMPEPTGGTPPKPTQVKP